jgi:hypothetical protein
MNLGLAGVKIMIEKDKVGNIIDLLSWLKEAQRIGHDDDDDDDIERVV